MVTRKDFSTTHGCLVGEKPYNEDPKDVRYNKCVLVTPDNKIETAEHFTWRTLKPSEDEAGDKLLIGSVAMIIVGGVTAAITTLPAIQNYGKDSTWFWLSVVGVIFFLLIVIAGIVLLLVVYPSTNASVEADNAAKHDAWAKQEPAVAFQ
jgi:hypothetical protein